MQTNVIILELYLKIIKMEKVMEPFIVPLVIQSFLPLFIHIKMQRREVVLNVKKRISSETSKGKVTSEQTKQKIGEKAKQRLGS